MSRGEGVEGAEESEVAAPFGLPDFARFRLPPAFVAVALLDGLDDFFLARAFVCSAADFFFGAFRVAEESWDALSTELPEDLPDPLPAALPILLPESLGEPLPASRPEPLPEGVPSDFAPFRLAEEERFDF